jgi:uncharacterized protein YdhG (YjbR/CyaY superfamily)
MNKRNNPKSVPAKDVDEYLAGVPKEARATLEKLRKTIKATAPKATEVISYQIPMYKHHGMLLGFAAFKDHCSFFVGPAVMNAHKEELKRYDTSKGTIRFPAGNPLPATLVKKLVKARIEQNEALRSKKKKK